MKWFRFFKRTKKEKENIKFEESLYRKAEKMFGDGEE